ncbi:MAG TPA: hypothetical protein VN758_07455 [Solirubrobacterales bacterium]|nr:hypothetical protein [Solirubrobacterales bacterium]
MRSKNLIKALGLSLMAALGLFAFTATGASAANLTPATHVHGKILVLGSEHLLANFTGHAALGQLLVPTLGVEIHCKLASIEGVLLSGLKGEALATVLFEDCKVYEWNGTTLGGQLPCNISNGGANHHITAKAILLVVTHEGKLYIVAEPDVAEPLKAGEPFVEIKYESGKGCPIPLSQKVTGSYAFEITGLLHPITTLNITPGNAALQTLLGTGLFYGVSAATLDPGAATIALSGIHLGCTWGII